MIEFAGLKFKNPFVVASGPPTAKLERLRLCEKYGAAGASLKLTFVKQDFYGKLRMYSVPGEASIVNHERRLDLDEGVVLAREAKRETSLILFANITHPADDLQGWQKLARAMEEAGVDAIEANLGCPNLNLTERQLEGAEVKKSGVIAGQDPVLVGNITRALKEAVDIPVVIKLTPNVTDITQTAKAAVEAGADGITSAGTQISLPPVDIYNGGRPLYPFLKGASFGSLGGPVCRLQSYAMVAQIARRFSIPIIGGGGIETWEHAINFMMWGATLITVCTEIMWRGFWVIRKIVNGMERFRVEQGYNSYSEITGLSLGYLRPSSELETIDGTAVIDQEKCKKCALCYQLGHCDAIVREDKRYRVLSQRCLTCAICIDVCPYGAIYMVEGAAI